MATLDDYANATVLVTSRERGPWGKLFVRHSLTKEALINTYTGRELSDTIVKKAARILTEDVLRMHEEIREGSGIRQVWISGPLRGYNVAKTAYTLDIFMCGETIDISCNCHFGIHVAWKIQKLCCHMTALMVESGNWGNKYHVSASVRNSWKKKVKL
jgi:hypothetical protein